MPEKAQREKWAQVLTLLNRQGFVDTAYFPCVRTYFAHVHVHTMRMRSYVTQINKAAAQRIRACFAQINDVTAQFELKSNVNRNLKLGSNEAETC